MPVQFRATTKARRLHFGFGDETLVVVVGGGGVGFRDKNQLERTWDLAPAALCAYTFRLLVSLLLSFFFFLLLHVCIFSLDLHSCDTAVTIKLT